MKLENYSKDIQDRIAEVRSLISSQDGTALFRESKAFFDYVSDYNDNDLKGYAAYVHAESAVYVNDDGSEFREYIMLALRYLREADDKYYLAKSYNLLGISSLYDGNTILGLECFYEALDCAEPLHDKYLTGILKSNVSSVYYDVKQFQESLKLNIEAVELMQSDAQDPRYRINVRSIYCSMGFTYLKLEVPDVKKAEEAIKHVEELLDENTDSIDYFLYLSLKTRILNFDANRFDERDKVIREMISLIGKLVDISEIIQEFSEFLSFLTEEHLDKYVGDFAAALEKEFNETRSYSGKIEILDALINYYSEIGDIEKKERASIEAYSTTKLLDSKKKDEIKTFLDIRERVEKLKKEQRKITAENKMLEKNAWYDALTDLPNRYRLNEIMDEAFEKAFNSKENLGVEILDIDYFKQYNDTFGHLAGDDVLKSVAACLMEVAGESSAIHVARYGGDEFVIIYEGFSDAEVMEYSNEIRARVNRLKISNPGALNDNKFISVSQGIRNSVPHDKNKVWDYFYAADNALYQVKKSVKGEIALMHNVKISDTSLDDVTQF